MEPLLWICGQRFQSKDQPQRCWEFQGVFDQEYKAVAACITKDFFIFPAQLNEALPIAISYPEGAYYPQLETKEQAQARK